MSAALLEVRGLSVRFARVEALRDVSLDVEAGSVVGLIGPNGAGKTTLIDAVAGFVPVEAGTISLAGTRVEGLPPHRRARLGLARTFQSLELFEDLGVGENLLVAAEAKLPRGRAHRAEAARRVAAAAGGLGLEQLTDRVPPTLSHAERVRLAVGRAVASEPKLVLLDEPAAGLDTDQRAALAGRIRQLAQRGLAVVLVDHDMGFVFELCDQVWALDLGRVIAHGSPSAVRADADVVAAYLGPDRSAPGRAAPGRAAPTSEPGEPRAAEPRVAAPDAALREQGPPGGSSLALQVQHLSAGYGGVPVVRDVSLCVGAGEVVALLGPNGAGKTTTLRAFSGLLPVLGGSVAVLGAPARGRADRLARRGLAHVPQGRALSPGLSVRDHLRMATRGRRSAAEEVLQEFPALVALLDRPAGRLSGGEQHMLALARALVAPHRLLVVDEVSLGLAPRLVERLLATLRRVASEEQAGVLVVEQHVGLALAVADRAYVMHGGRVVLEGPAPALAGDPALLASSYLGAGRPGPEPA